MNLPLFKSKIELNIYRPGYNLRVHSIIITHQGRQKPLPISIKQKVLMEDPFCWGPSASEGPQKQDLTVFLEYNV
jgi:hypothetical protein